LNKYILTIERVLVSEYILSNIKGLLIESRLHLKISTRNEVYPEHVLENIANIYNHITIDVIGDKQWIME